MELKCPTKRSGSPLALVINSIIYHTAEERTVPNRERVDYTVSGINYTPKEQDMSNRKTGHCDWSQYTACFPLRSHFMISDFLEAFVIPEFSVV